MNKIAATFAALTLATLPSTCNVTGKPGASLSLVGMAHAQKVDLGLEGVTGPAATEFVLAAIISKDGAVVDTRYFARQGATVVFDDKDSCEAFKQLPFYPQIVAQLDEFVAKEFPGATAVTSCVPRPE